jgi:hypothetical protein
VDWGEYGECELVAPSEHIVLYTHTITDVCVVSLSALGSYLPIYPLDPIYTRTTIRLHFVYEVNLHKKTSDCKLLVELEEGVVSWSKDVATHIRQSFTADWTPRTYSELYNRGIRVQFISRGVVMDFYWWDKIMQIIMQLLVFAPVATTLVIYAARYVHPRRAIYDASICEEFDEDTAYSTYAGQAAMILHHFKLWDTEGKGTLKIKDMEEVFQGAGCFAEDVAHNLARQIFDSCKEQDQDEVTAEELVDILTHNMLTCRGLVDHVYTRDNIKTGKTVHKADMSHSIKRQDSTDSGTRPMRLPSRTPIKTPDSATSAV